jgi:arsenite methyltransferase
MSTSDPIKEAVKRAYGSLARGSEENCCGSPQTDKLARIGYTNDQVKELPESVVAMADGCGNPTALGTIREGDTVLDLGSGGGIDVFLASRRVGRSGRVIGLDMTPDMVRGATDNAAKMKLDNVEFKLGEIEHIPMDPQSVDVIMSNCVICLSPDKESVFREMFRVLRPGGRLAIADEVALTPFSNEEKSDPDKWCKCIAGAVTETEYTGMLERVGFQQVRVHRLRSPSETNPVIFSAFISGNKAI